jgi:hypothetical protein
MRTQTLRNAATPLHIHTSMRTHTPQYADTHTAVWCTSKASKVSTLASPIILSTSPRTALARWRVVVMRPWRITSVVRFRNRAFIFFFKERERERRERRVSLGFATSLPSHTPSYCSLSLSRLYSCIWMHAYMRRE